ncbi:hypothetical protein GCM10027036_18820 [Flavihumibacter cheonanensis]
MTINYIVSEDEYLQYYLYTTSKNKLIQQKVLLRRIFTPVAFFITGLLMIDAANGSFFIFFLMLSICTFVFYSHYTRWLYKRHYKRHIHKELSKFIGQPTSITLDGSSIFIQDKFGESRIQLEAIEHLIEIPDYFVLRFHGGMGMAIKKIYFSQE